MTTSLERWGLEGNFVSTNNYYCIKRDIANQNPTSTFSDVEFTMSCSSGASYLSMVVGSTALAISAYLF